MSDHIRLGDKVSVSIHDLFTRHYGVCTGFDLYGEPVFIHNTWERGRVTRATLDEFSHGRRVRVDQRAQAGKAGLVVRRAESLLGQKYDFVRFNCEHAANYALTGRGHSNQILVGGLLLVGLLGLGLVGAGTAAYSARA